MRPENRRRLFLAGAASSVFAWPAIPLAQERRPVVIGWLHPGSREASGRGLPAFKERMTALGWKDGSSYVVVARWADTQVERLPALAEELKASHPSVIVAVLDVSAIAVAKAAPNVPVVQVQGRGPVDSGLAASLARPGGMVTGVINMITEVSGKYLELLIDAAPGLERVGFLTDDARPAWRVASMEQARRAAARYPVEVRFAEARTPAEIEPAMQRLAKESVQALVLLPSTWFTSERRRIVRGALARRWPVIAGPQSFVEEGALLAYSADSRANFRRAAEYVDRILKGAKPGDLPIEQSASFVLAVNLKTAKALGITLPQSILLQATRVIE
ncbi:MAG: ABC transporter substrate-binding protein [Burkholderiales bacterium]|nr:ABC transporter substrate-binding protein [Burkholderiales bacterium]